MGREEQEPTCKVTSASIALDAVVFREVQLVREPVGVFIRVLQGYHDFLMEGRE